MNKSLHLAVYIIVSRRPDLVKKRIPFVKELKIIMYIHL